MEESPVEDSKSNGYVGRAVQAVQDQTRTMKSALEGMIGDEVRSDHPGLLWLVELTVCRYKALLIVKLVTSAARALTKSKFSSRKLLP